MECSCRWQTDTLPVPYEPNAFSASPGELGTELGQFQARKGRRQIIKLKILNDAGELNLAHPKLKVEAHRVYWEQWVIFRQLGFLIAVLFGGVGQAAIVIPPLVQRRTKAALSKNEVL
jgi:hypothetical protein